MNTKRVYSLLPELARNASIEYGASLGMVIILTSIFERVLIYFLKIEFFLTSNLEYFDHTTLYYLCGSSKLRAPKGNMARNDGAQWRYFLTHLKMMFV